MSATNSAANAKPDSKVAFAGQVGTAPPTAATATATAATGSSASSASATTSGGVDTSLVIPPLIVSQQPQNSLAYTNFVFVAPGTPNALPKGEAAVNYVMIKGGVFVVQAHPSMKAGAVGLNKLQRESLSLADGDTVDLQVYNLPGDSTFALHAIRLEFDVYGNTQRIIFKEDEMLQPLRSALAGQVFTKGQTFWGKFDKFTLVYQVKSMEAPIKEEKDQKKRGHLTHPVQLGLITASTKVKLAIKPDKNKILTLEETDEIQPLFNPDWSFSDMGIGGLDAEFGVLFRRAFASRLFPATVIQQLGIKHVKGMLLYGPPGTGKTLIARQIGKLLKGKDPKVVNGPEILNKFVGQSEENIRNLFVDAEKDEKEKKEKSPLHIIIFDEIDAICKQRGTMSGSTGVHDTVVNQLLSKIDGVNALNNILVIGMTNRKDMIDAALLRPGRLEVHIEIGLPDAKGREQILKIHTKNMKEHGKLDSDVNLPKLAESAKNFSGAELEGLVKSASSFALYSTVDATDKLDLKLSAENIVVNMAHFERALLEVTPAFGVADDDLKNMIRGELLDYSPEFERLLKVGYTWLTQVKNSPQTPLLSVLLEGEVGSGKTALAAKLALDSGFPFTKVVSPEMYVGYSESAKCSNIAKIFEDAYKSPLSLIILDNIERLLEYVPIGPRFSNQVLQTLLVLIKRIPPNADRKLMVIATTSSLSILKDMEFKQTFNVISHVPSLTKPEHIVRVFQQMRIKIEEKEMDAIAHNCVLPIGIKQLMMLIEMAKSSGQSMSASRFLQCVADCGLDTRKAKSTAAVEIDFDKS